MQRRSILKAGAGAAATLAMPQVFAQMWPSGPIRIVVGFPPGGGTDALARVVANKLTQMWNQQVIVETKAGVAGVLAADYVAQQPSDGTTLLMAHINSHALAPSLQPKMNYSVERDFVPIVLVGVTPNLLIAHPAEAKTVKDVVAQCKAKPGQVSFGSAGQGSAQHLALEMFKLRAKVDAIHVPYKGSGPALTDLMGGQIQAMFDTVASCRPHIQSGKVRPLAVTTAKRSSALPDVPTLAESGLTGFDIATWFGLMAPAGTPPHIVEKIQKEVATMLATPEMRSQLATAGAEPVGSSSQQMAQQINAEVQRFSALAKKINLDVE